MRDLSWLKTYQPYLQAQGKIVVGQKVWTPFNQFHGARVKAIDGDKATVRCCYDGELTQVELALCVDFEKHEELAALRAKQVRRNWNALGIGA